MAVDNTNPPCKLTYFFAGRKDIPPAWSIRFSALQWGMLAEPLDGNGSGNRESDGAPTPTGAPGLFVAVGSGWLEGERVGYFPAEQEWAEIEDGVWVGILNTATPSDFYRRELSPDIRNAAMMANAMGVTTDRGCWMIPVAMIDAENCQLPTVDRYEKGAWKTAPRPAFQQIARDALAAYRHEIGEQELTREEQREICIRALQVNHALTGPELSIMGVLFPDAYDTILGILTDRRARKKKAKSAIANTVSGEPGA